MSNMSPHLVPVSWHFLSCLVCEMGWPHTGPEDLKENMIPFLIKEETDIMFDKNIEFH